MTQYTTAVVTKLVNEFLVCNYQLQLSPRQGSIQWGRGASTEKSNCSVVIVIKKALLECQNQP